MTRHEHRITHNTREEIGCGGNEDVEIDEWIPKLDRTRNEITIGTAKVGEILKVQERMLKLYGHVLRREE